MVEIDDLDKLTEGMGRLDGPRAGLDEFDELLSLEAQWNEVSCMIVHVKKHMKTFLIVHAHTLAFNWCISPQMHLIVHIHTLENVGFNVGMQIHDHACTHAVK
jgi:hypothetical protein